jgi:hypothetical protein
VVFHVPSWFYVFSGLVLSATGALQLAMRPDRSGIRRFTGAGAFFSLLFIGLGLLVAYYGAFVHR